MKLREIRGLKYPDEFVIKFFFKHALHVRTGNVLELGCSNGSNLLLFYEYGWNVVGVDIASQALDDAKHNFGMAAVPKVQFHFIQRDLVRGLHGAGLPQLKFDVILLPSVLYYIPRQSTITLLKELDSLLNKDALIYLRNRSPRDYRYRRGIAVERNGFRLTETETGEEGLLNVFYDEWELVDMLREHLDLDMQLAEVLNVEFQNPQQGVRIQNSDIIVWGRIKSKNSPSH
jgi:SAM-dependent methyltransferase